MNNQPEVPRPTLRFYHGMRVVLQRGFFLTGSMKYLFDRKHYPLFRLNPWNGGALRTLKIAYDLKLRRIARFGEKHFTALTVPRYPSRAFDHMVARGGLNTAAAGTPMKPQIDTVILGITRNCDLHCQHCYERFNTGIRDVISLTRWNDIIRQIQDIGASVVVLSGGEPFGRFERLLGVLEAGDKDRSDFHVHTSGHGVTPRRAEVLRSAGVAAVAVGLDDVDRARHDAIRRFKGAHEEALEALRIFHEAGIFAYVNTCLSSAMIRAGDLWRLLELAKSLHVGYIQLLEPRPCGGYFRRKNDVLLNSADRKTVMDFVRKANVSRRFKDYPIVYSVAHAESPEQMGCMMGGLSHLHIDSRGNVNPCVFLPVTFGNILKEDFPAIYMRMRRAIPHPIHKECPSLTLAPAIRTRAARDHQIPIPYNAIEKEWTALMSE